MKTVLRKILPIVAILLLALTLAGCGETCTKCGSTIFGSVYGDMFNSDTRMCESCARNYYMGLNIDNFKIS